MTQTKIKQWLWLVLLVSGLSMGSAVLADENLQPSPSVGSVDPYEKFNRGIYAFNEWFDKWFAKPVATLYNKIIPKPLNKGLSNFFSNLNNVPTIANDVLQANFYQATSDAWRLAINSTVGLLGFFDWASDIGLDENTEDFGLTMAHWGYKNSNYLVLPFIGPSTLRDGIGFFINYEFLTVYPYIDPPRDRYRLYLASLLDKRADLLRFQDVLEQAAIDKYVFLRDAYMQRRAYQIQRNKELGDPYLNNDLNNEENK